MSPAETRYSAYDRELLAIFSALKFFRHILEGRTFVIKTDHLPITHAFNQRADKASPRQLRQLDFISQFNAPIVHISGDDNAVADALSRVEAISMPAVLDALTIAQAQQKDTELEKMSTQTTLNLQKVTLDGQSIFGRFRRPCSPVSASATVTTSLRNRPRLGPPKWPSYVQDASNKVHLARHPKRRHPLGSTMPVLSTSQSTSSHTCRDQIHSSPRPTI